MPDKIEIRGARVHNLQNIDIDIPLNQLVAVAGVSGSGKSSLALGVVYAEGSRRYLEALSAYTRRRLTQAANADLDSIENVPAALALHQRPTVPNVRSTFGTMTELLNSIRLMFSRLGSHRCPQGHYLPPTVKVALDKNLVCPVCKTEFAPPSAESFSFNSDGACPTCSGTGAVREIDDSKLVPDQTKTLAEGAVEAWNMFGISWMYRVAGELGVRLDVPFQELSDEEKKIIYEGEEVSKYVLIPSKNGKMFDLNCKYRNAHQAVVEALNGAETEKGLERINKYLVVHDCPACGGTRLSEKASSSLLVGKTLPEVCALTLTELIAWVKEIPAQMPKDLRAMAESIVNEFLGVSARLIDLGLGYLTLDRTGASLSTGELQRVQLARAVRNKTTGVLYVLDEPSIGLHPANVDGLLEVMRDLLARGNSVIVVDHDVRVIETADYVIEMGKGAGKNGGRVVSCGSVAEVENDSESIIGKYLAKTASITVGKKIDKSEIFAEGRIKLSTRPLHTVHALDVEFPKGRLTAITGVSGSGKTTLILESLIPALQAKIADTELPQHVKSIEAEGIDRVSLIDATPIGTNVRSTVATYSGVLNDLRKAFATTKEAKALGLKANDFSYNTGKLRCPNCDGTGQISLDVQFLPDVDIICPDCGGLRYSKEVEAVKIGGATIAEFMAMSVHEAVDKLSSKPKIKEKLQTLDELGLGYLTLGEGTPALSGGEAQRLKLATEMGRRQESTVFVFDEPTIGLHPDDVRLLLTLFHKLIASGATVLVIEHDLDLIANADYIVDMGPGGGLEGGQIVAIGTPDDLAHAEKSITGKYLC